MAGTLNIPLATLTVGTHVFGPAAVADTDTLAVLTIDRTVTKGNVKGFNGQPSTTLASVTIDQSNDGGTTWNQLASFTFSGGVVVLRGVQQNTSDIGVEFWSGTGRQARAEVIVTGASVAVQGTLVTS